MARDAKPPLILQLQNAGYVGSQVSALRALKNETIGHDQRKEAFVRWGLIPILAQTLVVRQPSGRNVAISELNGAGNKSRSEEDEACMQAIIILGSLAQGGPAFLSPILASGIPSTLLSILSSPTCPTYLCVPILRTLNTIADRIPLQSQQYRSKDTRLADLLFQREHVGCLARILGQDYGSQQVTVSIELTASLVEKLCTEESQKALLADCGVLDALSAKIASFIVAQGFVLPGAEEHVSAPGALGAFPAPAPPTARLAPILRAVTVIVEHSKWRAEHFLSSPGILTVFPKQPPDFAPHDVRKGPWGSTYLSGSAVPRHPGASPIEYLLPSVPLPQSKNSASALNFPPLGYSGTHRRHSQPFPTPFSLLDTSATDEEESALVPWLLYILRAKNGIVRLVATRLVTVLFRLDLAKRHRVSMLGAILIPILIQMMDNESDVQGVESSEYEGLIPVMKCVKEEAPAVLALLVMDEQELQRHAVDGGALKRLSQLLKDSFSPTLETARPMWHPDGEDEDQGSEAQDSPVCKLGPPGYSPIHCHLMRYRANILRALGALIPFKDEYRKAICDNGVVPYIIDSLKPSSNEPPTETSNSKNSAADGNPTPTLLAACGAVRMLTRSVSILRTNLIDAGVASPLFVLIRYPDIEVQIAATAVICNLALDFSPMRDAIITGDTLPLLCENTHSPNTKLRLESLWALKHTTYRSTNDVRIKIIDGLGGDWIKQIITQDPTRALAKRGLDAEMEGITQVGMGRANSAGEQVDLLNPVEDSQDQDEDMNMTDSVPSSKMSLASFLPDATRRRKLALSGDLDQTTQARQDDIAVQAQTFDLLRNLMSGDHAAEVVDCLFKHVGQDVFLDSLADKLRPRTISLPHRRESSSNKTLHVSTEILIAVVYNIIHLAASVPRHRDLVMNHRDILPYLMNYFHHSHREIRTGCLWTVINLTYPDDHTDIDLARDRASRLCSMGIMDRLTPLLDDSDLDVRERSKTAEHLIRMGDPERCGRT